MAKVPISISVDEEIKEWLDETDYPRSQRVNNFLSEEMLKDRLGTKQALKQRKAELEAEKEELRSETKELENRIKELEKDLEEADDIEEDIAESVIEFAESLIPKKPEYRDTAYKPVASFSRTQVKDIIETVGVHYARVIDVDHIEVSNGDKLTQNALELDCTDDWGQFNSKDRAEEYYYSLTDEQRDALKAEVEDRLEA